MSNIIMRDNKAAGLKVFTAAQPLGIEYEKLMRDLKFNAERKYYMQDNNLKDMRKNITKSNKSFIINPGLSDKNFDEPNGKPAYPQNGIPYSQGQIWSD